MKYTIVIALILSSCSSLLDEIHYEVDPQLKPYIDRFYQEAQLRQINPTKQNLVIRLQNGLAQSHHAWGLTIKDDNSSIITILIDQDAYNFYNQQSNNPIGLEPIIFHEMGHAILNLSHNTCSNSLMNPGVLDGGNCYKDDSVQRKNFIDQLFGLIKCS